MAEALSFLGGPVMRNGISVILIVEPLERPGRGKNQEGAVRSWI